MQRFTSRATWDCPLCDHMNAQDIPVPELNFLAEDSADMATEGWAEIICEGCDTNFSGTVYVNTHGTSFEIDDPQAISFSGDMPMYEPEEDYDPPEDPYSIAMEALSQLSLMAGTLGPDNDPQFINRLVFAGAISSLEAYLGDTLINSVQEDADIRNALLKNNKVLGEITITAAELAADEDILTKRLTSSLRSYLYHNLKTVSALYRAAFDIPLSPSKEESDILFRAMPLRHDCVHRNGRTPTGEKLTIFDKEYVDEVISAIEAVVQHIEFRNYKDEDMEF